MSARPLSSPRISTRRATVARRLNDAWNTLSPIKTCRQALEWMDFTHRQRAAVLEMFGFSATRTTVSHWIIGDRLAPDAAREAWQESMRWRIGLDTDHKLTLNLTKHWRVVVYRRCDSENCHNQWRARNLRDLRRRYCRKCRR